MALGFWLLTKEKCIKELAQVAPRQSDPLQSNRFVSLGPAPAHATKRGCITIILHALHMCSVPSNQLVQVVHSNLIHSSPTQNLGVQQFNLLMVFNHTSVALGAEQ
jgi:hypothetical protein|uniref:Uncharacterized protein n=1 Tax=Eutreptiella gymnastica TaxID=73025 RepID=A0A6T2D9J8_9EUGL